MRTRQQSAVCGQLRLAYRWAALGGSGAQRCSLTFMLLCSCCTKARMSSADALDGMADSSCIKAAARSGEVQEAAGQGPEAGAGTWRQWEPMGGLGIRIQAPWCLQPQGSASGARAT